MMLARKDYRAIAEIIESNRGDGVEYILDRVASNLADYFEQNNPRFDRQKFIKACDL